MVLHGVCSKGAQAAAAAAATYKPCQAAVEGQGAQTEGAVGEVSAQGQGQPRRSQRSRHFSAEAGAIPEHSPSPHGSASAEGSLRCTPRAQFQ